MEQSFSPDAPPRAERRTRTWRKARGGIVVLGALGLAGTLMVNALFTDSSTVPNNTFASGTVDIGTTPSGSVAIAYSDMAPGDFTSAPITVSNSGTLNLRYAVSSVTDTDTGLTPVLKTWIRRGVAGDATTCTSGMSIAAFQAWGTADVYGTSSGIEDTNGTGGAAIGSVAGTNLIGDPTTGAQSGDRTLNGSTAGAQSEALCVRVLLPKSTTGTPTSGYQNKSTTATLTFTAEQTKNN